MGTPVVVHEDGGALFETGFLSGGGLAYRTDTELLDRAAADGPRSSAARRSGIPRVCHPHRRMVGIRAPRALLRICSKPHELARKIGPCRGRISSDAARPARPCSKTSIADSSPRLARRETAWWSIRHLGRCDTLIHDLADSPRPTGVRESFLAAARSAPRGLRQFVCSLDYASRGALLVDGKRPSIDCANSGDARPIGNDLTFVFLPHHLAVSKIISSFGHLPMWDARGFGGRPSVGNPQAGLFYPPVWAVWWGPPSLLGWLTAGHLLVAGLGVYVLLRSLARGRWAATVGGFGIPGFAILAGAHLRGSSAARLGGRVVSLGILGFQSGASAAALPAWSSCRSFWR